MPDREKVIKGLKLCKGWEYKCDNCPYFDPDLEGMCDSDQLFTDAIALLKKQEAKNVTWRVGRAHCPSCGELFPKKQDKKYIRFCNYCGQAVKWE